MKILLSGINSFVGSSLFPMLHQAGHEVIGILRSEPNNHYKYIRGDLAEPTTYNSLPKDLDVVIHLAAVTPPQASINDFFLNNVEATRLLVNFSKESGIKKFIYASTVSIYGSSDENPLHETSPLINPSPYGISKFAGELFLQEAVSYFPSYCLRLPMIIGKGATRHWLANVYEKILSHQELIIYNPNALFNTCIHVRNLCDFIFNILTSSTQGHHCMNVASCNPITINQCVLRMAELLNIEPILKITDASKPSCIINTERAMAFGFKPWSMEEALGKWIQ